MQRGMWEEGVVRWSLQWVCEGKSATRIGIGRGKSATRIGIGREECNEDRH